MSSLLWCVSNSLVEITGVLRQGFGTPLLLLLVSFSFILASQTLHRWYFKHIFICYFRWFSLHVMLFLGVPCSFDIALQCIARQWDFILWFLSRHSGNSHHSRSFLLILTLTSPGLSLWKTRVFPHLSARLVVCLKPALLLPFLSSDLLVRSSRIFLIHHFSKYNIFSTDSYQLLI